MTADQAAEMLKILRGIEVTLLIGLVLGCLLAAYHVSSGRSK